MCSLLSFHANALLLRLVQHFARHHHDDDEAKQRRGAHYLA